MRLLAIALALVLAGCANTAKEVVYQTQKVEVPVQVPCKVKAPAKPAKWPMDLVEEAHDFFKKAMAALQEIEERRAYEHELEAAVKACQ